MNYVYIIVFANKNFRPVGAFDARDIAVAFAEASVPFLQYNIVEMPLWKCDNVLPIGSSKD